MNTLVIVLTAAACLLAGYTLYGRWLANKWGIDPKAKTPAVRMEDGEDYVPTDGWTVFAHQFSSIAGAGPVTGAIQAAAFGWLPVFLWIVIGGIFFGAVTDFGALYASVKNEGKSMGLLIEKYIGKTGRKLFLLFCWLFTLIVTAAFALTYGGTLSEAFLSAVTGFVIAVCLYACRRLKLPSFFGTLLSSAAASVLASGFLRMFPFFGNLDSVIIASIMPLVPGVAITNAVFDTLHGDYLSGTARMLEAFVTAAAVAMGIGIGLGISG